MFPRGSGFPNGGGGRFSDEMFSGPGRFSGGRQRHGGMTEGEAIRIVGQVAERLPTGVLEEIRANGPQTDEEYVLLAVHDLMHGRGHMRGRNCPPPF